MCHRNTNTKAVGCHRTPGGRQKYDRPGLLLPRVSLTYLRSELAYLVPNLCHSNSSTKAGRFGRSPGGRLQCRTSEPLCSVSSQPVAPTRRVRNPAGSSSRVFAQRFLFSSRLLKKFDATATIERKTPSMDSDESILLRNGLVANQTCVASISKILFSAAC